MTEGREATTAHPLCTCVQDVVMVASFLGAWLPDWPGPKTEPRVTAEGRAGCPLHHGPCAVCDDGGNPLTVGQPGHQAGDT